MPRGILLSVPAEDFDWYSEALRLLADELISQEEAGQRGEKRSVFLRMILTAYIRDAHATVEAMQAVKQIAHFYEPPKEPDRH